MTETLGDIVCFEASSDDRPPWTSSVEALGADLESLRRLAKDGIIKLDVEDDRVAVSGSGQVGLVILPSQRRLIIRSKVPNLVLLEWLAYEGEFPPLDFWLPDAGLTTGDDLHVSIARLYLYELEKVTRLHLRKDYTPVTTDETAIRGRIMTTRLHRRLHRLPHVPQLYRTRTFDTKYNVVLALALDKLPLLLADSSERDRRKLARLHDDRQRLARLRDMWIGVDRVLADPISSVTEAQWASPPGYRSALQLARLILIGAAIDPVSGTGGQAFTSPLALIWESSLRRMFDDLSTVTGWACVSKSQRTRRWDDPVGQNDPTRRLEADVIVERSGARWVLDTKYKCAFGDESRVDRFQMCAYAIAFDADKVSLVYPTAKGENHAVRTLLDTNVGSKNVRVDSIELPMSAGPDACKTELTKLIQAQSLRATSRQLMDSAKMKPSKIVHETLPDHTVEALRVIYRHFAHYSYPTFEQFELEFLREADPGLEIALWKRMTIIFRAYCTHFSPSRGEEREVHDLMIKMSLGLSPDDPRCRAIGRVAERCEQMIESYRHR